MRKQVLSQSMYGKTRQDKTDRYHQILQLVKIILVLPIHTAEVERGFSQMNLIMTDKRNCLTTASLRSLLSIKRSKTDYKAYDPSGAIIRWAPVSALRRRRINSQPYGPRKKQVKEQYQDVPVSEAEK